jgi:hypothetical protein
MTRAEVYAKIKEYDLQVEIKNKYGFNYTNLSTATLASVVADYEAFKNTPTSDCKCSKLIELLYKKHLLCKSEYEALMA